MFKLFLVAYNLAFPVLYLLYLPFYVLRLRRRGEFKTGFFERFGIYSAAKRRQVEALTDPVWVHAVSVGEVVAALGFMQQWRQRQPDVCFLLTTTTNTAQTLARGRAPDYVVPAYFPIDFFPCCKRAFDLVKPRLLVIFEVEIWPTLVSLAAARQTGVALVNCRLSERSTRGFRRWRCFFRHVFAKLSLTCAQSDADAERFRQVAGNDTELYVCGTMKFDLTPDIGETEVDGLLEGVFGPGEHLYFCAASTHQGEEEIVLRAFKRLSPQFPALRLVLAPRHAERTPQIEALVRAESLRYATLTQARLEPPTDEAEALLIDTTGDLPQFLAASDIVFMGKSLGGNTGGHNIIEPAIFGKPIVFGPEMQNFREVARIFLERQAAVQVADEEGLGAALEQLLGDPSARERLSRASRATVEENRGAIDRTITLLEQLA